MSLGKVTPWKNIGRWTVGVNNVEDAQNLTDREAVKLENVDLDDMGKATLRKGKTLLLSGAYKWLSNVDPDVCLALYGDSLVSLLPDFSGHMVLKTGLLANRIVYAKVLDRIYWTNGQYFEYVQNSASHALPTPTEEFKEVLPPGEFLEYHAGRLWVGRAGNLWFSDALVIGQKDSRMAPKAFEGNLTLVKSVKNGMFIADTKKTYFMAIKDPTELVPDALKPVAFYGAIPHAVAQVDGALVASGKTENGKMLFWASEKGICLGNDDGEFANVTMQRYEMNEGYTGSALARKNHRGTSQVIMTITQ